MIPTNEPLVISPSDWKYALDSFAAKMTRAPRASVVADRDGVAVVNVHGLLLPTVPDTFRAWGFDATGYDEIESAMNAAAADPKVKTIVLHVDSGGGMVKGVDAAALSIRDARAVKPVIAYVGGICASGAYWLASQATEIQASPVSEVGSIGVYSVMYDYSVQAERDGIQTHVLRSAPHKGAGTIGEKITDEQLAARQETIDALAGQFVDDVALGRNVPRETAQGWASGRAWIAGTALELGLIDYVGSVNTKGTKTMNEEEIKASAEEGTADVLAVEEAGATAESESEVTATETETENTATTDHEQPADNTEADPVALERERCSAILTTFAAWPEFAQTAIASGLSLDAAKAAHWDALKDTKAETTSAVPFTATEETPSVKTWADAVNMIAERDGVTKAKAGLKASREFPELHRQAQGL